MTRDGATPTTASAAPLHLYGNPGHDDWMRLQWSKPVALIEAASLPAQPSLYCIVDLEAGSVRYIGPSAHVRNRVRTHARRDWACQAGLRYHLLPPGTPVQHLYEWESDLLGAYYQEQGHPPCFQYGA